MHAIHSTMDTVPSYLEHGKSWHRTGREICRIVRRSIEQGRPLYRFQEPFVRSKTFQKALQKAFSRCFYSGGICECS